MGAARRAVMAVVIALLLALGLIAVPTAASAAPGDIGYVGNSYSGATNPTADKPQSKLWFHDGRWWANMFDPGTTDWYIYYLDRATHTWKKTATRVDERPNTSSDTLWDGTNLYIGTHVVRSSGSVSSTSAPMRLYRYSWDGTKFVINSGFPKIISNNSSESLTIDKDSRGTVWATWTKVTATGSPGSGQVFVNDGTGNGTTWGTPFVMPTTGSANPNVAQDDISALVAFGGNRVGVLWSNQKDNTVYWSVHADGAPRATWSGGIAVRGNKLPDDHLNIKSIQADQAGRVFAAVKTSLDQAGAGPDAAQINVLVFKPGTGSWTSTTFGRIRDCHTRPQVMLDEATQTVHVFATGRTAGGTCTSTGAGSIYMKSAPMDNPSFPTGDGTPILRNAAADSLNNVTTSKQSATSASGIVVLASHEGTKRYWHNEIGGTTPPPTGDSTAPSVPTGVTATADSSTQVTVRWTASTDNVGVASYRVMRGTTVVAGAVTGTSFVDTTAAASTTYSYTVSAVDAAGNRSGESTAATVTTPPSTTPPPPGGGVTVGESAKSGNTAAVTTVSVPKPGGVVAGDVLVAQITADDAPSISAAPAGWNTVISPLSVGTSARVFAYYKVAGASEPASYEWGLTTAVKWNAVITNFHGVNTTTPFDTAASTKVNTTAASSISVPGVSTTTAGAVLVGGAGPNNALATVAPPAGWTETMEANGAQTAEIAYQPRPTTGATGTATWTLNGSYTAAAWLRALKPA
jgi:hypothetical protein